MSLRPLLLIFLILSLAVCTKEDLTMSKIAENYLEEMINIMQAHSINRDRIDWADFRAQVYERAGTAQSVRDLRGAISRALTLLEDNHSFLRRSDGGFIYGASPNCSANPPRDLSIPADIAYVQVSAFSGSSSEALSFADELQERIRSADTSGKVGWIVDLRGNRGGNMWPMLAGIGPILGEGTAGFFIGPDGSESEWGYAEGRSYLSGSTIIRVSTPYPPLPAETKVAVLLDEEVTSSGEAIAIAFIGRPNTRSFGTPTCGLSTSNQTFNLSDGSRLFLTTAYMADRFREIYGASVEPDDLLEGVTATLEQAIAFLQE